VFVVLYVCIIIFVIALLVKRYDNWWDLWPVYVILTINLVCAIWMAPKMKYDTKPARGSGGGDLKTTLLPSKK